MVGPYTAPCDPLRPPPVGIIPVVILTRGTRWNSSFIARKAVVKTFCQYGGISHLTSTFAPHSSPPPSFLRLFGPAIIFVLRRFQRTQDLGQQVLPHREHLLCSRGTRAQTSTPRCIGTNLPLLRVRHHLNLFRRFLGQTICTPHGLQKAAIIVTRLSVVLEFCALEVRERCSPTSPRESLNTVDFG